METTIKPHEGIGEVLFGMTPVEVEKLLGKPDVEDTIENAAGEPALSLSYTHLGTTFIFEQDPPRLACIDIMFPDATLFGEPIVSLSSAAMRQLMLEHGFAECEEEEEAWGERCLSFPQANIDFYYEDDRLSDISIGQ